jgi:hypothetical protein
MRRFGDLPTRLVPYLEAGDPPADAAVAALAEIPGPERHAVVHEALAGTPRRSLPALDQLVAGARRVPPWVDWERLDRAASLFRRAGLLGGITLGLKSLVFGYAAPAGNKPLAFSGRLTTQADRRLAETGRFVAAVCQPGGLRPGELGWQLSLEVRLMHAQVRRLLLASGRWSHELWGFPINQHDMMATVLLFSKVFVDGLRQLGLSVSAQEADDYQHLWRWVGHLLGVVPELLPTTYGEASRLADFVHLTQGPPDDDSRALVRALLEGPRRRARQRAEHDLGAAAGAQDPGIRRELRLAEAHVAAASAVCRTLIGDELADALGLEDSKYRHVTRGVRLVTRALEEVRRHSSSLQQGLERLGDRYWAASVAAGLGGLPAVYALPERLDGSASGLWAH